MRAACVDFSHTLALGAASKNLPKTRRLAFFPGSSIGNFKPAEATRLLTRIKTLIGGGGLCGGGLLIGVDLKKDPAVLNAAYNDGQGVSAAFNLNLLRRLRDELGAGLSLDGFRHRAFYNGAAGRIEMHLESIGRQTIELGGRRFEFAAGETLHTENSYKYSVDEFRRLAAGAGYTPAAVWTDPAGLFSVHYLRG